MLWMHWNLQFHQISSTSQILQSPVIKKKESSYNTVVKYKKILSSERAWAWFLRGTFCWIPYLWENDAPFVFNSTKLLVSKLNFKNKLAIGYRYLHVYTPMVSTRVFYTLINPCIHFGLGKIIVCYRSSRWSKIHYGEKWVLVLSLEINSTNWPSNVVYNLLVTCGQGGGGIKTQGRPIKRKAASESWGCSAWTRGGYREALQQPSRT